MSEPGSSTSIRSANVNGLNLHAVLKKGVPEKDFQSGREQHSTLPKRLL